jgi:endoglucanase
VTAGTYSIAVTGPVAASSPSFKIDTGANLYGPALANSLFFYQNERDGPNYIASSLRTAPAHVNDQSAKVYLTPNANSSGRFSGDLTPTGATIDASGGWWDAGDYLKFVQTESYTVAMLLAGVRDFPNQMGAGSSSGNFTSEAKFGLAPEDVE